MPSIPDSHVGAICGTLAFVAAIVLIILHALL